MTTSTAATEPPPGAAGARGRPGFGCRLAAGLVAVLLAAVLPSARATMRLGPWEPVFKGIDHASGTNTPGGGFPTLNVIQVLRVDLTDPDIRLYSSPRFDNYAAGSRETAGYTVSGFLKAHQLQVAVNAGLFDPQEYYLPEGTAMDISGLSVSEGTVVSPQTSAAESAVIAFDAQNKASIIPTNWPAASTADMYTAVAGSYPVLLNGNNVGYNYRNSGGFIHQANPRTALGLSQDRRYLFILAIDGRQSGYSDGALDYETGAWLLEVGAADGVNMDGGGSTTLVIQDSTGLPVRLNQSSAVADSGRERTVGGHFGVYAKPVVRFIRDVAAQAQDTTATITWATAAPASTALKYGPTLELALATEAVPTPVTNHSVAITGLTPGKTYYFSAVSADASGTYTSPVQVFTTTNFVTQTQVFDVTQAWRYSTADLDGVAWTVPGYDDSAWAGPGAGLLWVDSRGAARDGIDPANTRLPANASTGGYPFVTYYFRTHFTVANVAGASLVVTNWIDDGAVFYLNGAEIQRVRMDDAPTVIANDTLALGYACSGDATCPDVFEVPAELVHLVEGDNVLAVEVHNYDRRSPDITFGATLDIVRPAPVAKPTLLVSRTASGLTLDWSAAGFVLQQADDPAGPWADVPGPVTAGPKAIATTGGPGYFRLRK